MTDFVEVAFRDFDNDRKTSGIPVDAGATNGERTAIHDQFVLWSAGSIGGTRNNVELVADSGVAATSSVAQGKLRGVIEMQDNGSGLIYREFIPMINSAKANDGGANVAWKAVGQGQQSLTVANPLHADFITLKAAMEAAWESPAGNAGTLSRMYIEE